MCRGWLCQPGWAAGVTALTAPNPAHPTLSTASRPPQIGRPVALLGASLGGATAIDFAAAHPDAVAKVVLVDAQAYAEGLGPLASAPRPLAALGVKLLRTEMLRRAANKMAYADAGAWATEDAMRVGRLCGVFFAFQRPPGRGGGGG